MASDHRERAEVEQWRSEPQHAAFQQLGGAPGPSGWWSGVPGGSLLVPKSWTSAVGVSDDRDARRSCAARGPPHRVAVNLLGPGYDYRATVSVWFRGIFLLNPDPSLMAGAPLVFQLHALAALGLLAIWPFTRLVHVWSVPLAYLWGPYLVYRRRPAGEGVSAIR